MLVVRIALTILCGIHHNLTPLILVGSNQCTTTRGGYHLIAVEAEDAILTESTQHLTVPATTKTLSSILHYRNTILVGNLHNAVNLIWHTIQSHRHNSRRLLARLGNTVLDSLLHQFRIHIPRILLRIHEHRCSPQICYRVT